MTYHVFCVFVLMLAQNSTAFSPTQRCFSLRINVNSCIFESTKLKSNDNVNEKESFEVEIEDSRSVNAQLTDELQQNDIKLTKQDKLQVLSYRSGLMLSAVLLSIQAIEGVSFLDGTGIDVDGVLRIVKQSQSFMPIVSGASLALCPMPKIVEHWTKSLGISSIAFGGLALILPEHLISHEVFWLMFLLAIVTLSVREIYYFGFEYKQECAIVLSMFPFMIDVNNHYSFTMPVCALGLGVLAAGKIFEPLKEDWVRSNSEFLAR